MICENCQDADIRGGLQNKYYIDPQGTYYPRIRRKGDHGALWEWKRTDSCQFCSFLYGTCYSKNPEGKKNKYIYPAADSGLRLLWMGDYCADGYRKFGAIWPDQDDQLMALDGFISQRPPLINCYDYIRNQISKCLYSHGDKAQPACQSIVDMPLQAQLKLIDCQTRKVIMAPSNSPYLALSYVWGCKPSSFDESKLPSTIEDAVTVTLKLRYRYLWVDQYCINQNSPEKLVHIKQMDRIYRNAEACIIAVAGDDHNHGLPGVSSPRSVLQDNCIVQIDSLKLLTYNCAPLDSSIRKSKWWQRGWTFQELLFARRRIYFTESEVLVECAYCTIREGLPWEYKPNSDAKNWEAGSEPFKQISRYSWPISDIHTEIYQDLIPTYTVRRLTQPTDIIEAFSGVFNSMDNLKHIWGIPVFRNINLDPSVWFLYGLTWHNSTNGKMGYSRRAGFPSWSWAGWYGEIEYMETPPHKSKSKYVGRVWIEQDSGPEISFEQYQHVLFHPSPIHEISSPPRFIHLECQCVPIQIRWVKPGEVRIFIGSDRRFWFRFDGLLERIPLRSGLDTAFGIGPQRVIDCFGLFLNQVDAINGQHLMKSPTVWKPVATDYDKLTISRFQMFVYDMGSYWERVGGFFFHYYQNYICACQLSNEKESGEDVYEDVYKKGSSNTDQFDTWLGSLSLETRKFRVG
jgi:Heterokaryon incompatibility protein (HET)